MDTWKDHWKLDIRGHEAFLALHRELREQMKLRWNRGVPFADELFDRWERAAFLGFGAGASVYDSSLVLGDVTVGEDTWVGPFTVLDGSGGLRIGHHCSISAGVQIYTHDTVKWALTGGKAPATLGPTVIGDRCYIGPLTIVAKHVTIGDCSVVGANSFVRSSIPPRSIAVGSPARVIGRVELMRDNEVHFLYDRKDARAETDAMD
jgi:acetyltransferase-like isoleucine patch superfamily enzyme